MEGQSVTSADVQHVDALASYANADYHQLPGVSASMLKVMNQSWRIFEATFITREIRREPSTSMALGTAIHAAILEPQRFDLEFVTDPGFDRRTKAHKEWLATVHPSMTVVRKDDMETLVRCRDSVYGHPVIAKTLTEEGLVEQYHVWTDAATGVLCRSKPDKILPSKRIIVDLKTTQNVDEFAKSVCDYSYHIQAAHYIAGAESVHEGFDEWHFVFAVVETKPPFRCRAVSLDSEALGIGFDTRARLLNEYAKRSSVHDWSDLNERELQTVSLPAWFLRKAN